MIQGKNGGFNKKVAKMLLEPKVNGRQGDEANCKDILLVGAGILMSAIVIFVPSRFFDIEHVVSGGHGFRFGKLDIWALHSAAPA